MCKQACLKTGEHSPCDHVSIYFPPNALKTIHLVCAFTGTELVSEFGEPMSRLWRVRAKEPRTNQKTQQKIVELIRTV